MLTCRAHGPFPSVSLPHVDAAARTLWLLGFADAAELLDDTVDGDAAAHRELATLWLDRLGRIDRALFHYRRAWETARDRQAVAALRALYTSLGEDAAVALLLEEELAETVDDASFAELELELGRLAARCGAPDEAARRLESLAGAGALARRADGAGRGAGRAPRRERAGRAAELRPSPPSGAPPATLTPRRPSCAAAWGSIPRSPPWPTRCSTSCAARNAGASSSGCTRRAGATPSARRCSRASSATARRPNVAGRGSARPGRRRCARCTPPTATGPSSSIAAERGLEERAPAERANELLALATLARDKLSDRERAAGYLRRVLDGNPAHEEARRRLVEHLRERRDWRGLADLLAREAERATGPDKLRRLEELAETCEQRLGDVERATAAWQALAELDPARGAAREALRRLGARARMWESLIGVLEKEAAAAATPGDKADALRRMAGAFRERQVDPLRAIALYEEALGLAPGDAPTLKALGELYERQGDDAGLLRTLRRQLEATAVKPAELGASARIERLALLRRVAALAENRGDTDSAVYACTAILELAPGERDALERLERVLERAGDAAGLEAALVYRAEAAGGPAERARALRRLARIADERGEPLLAMERWERLLAALPTDVEALRALARHYETAGVHASWRRCWSGCSTYRAAGARTTTPRAPSSGGVTRGWLTISSTTRRAR